MIILNDIHYMSSKRLQTALSLFEEGDSDLHVPYMICTSNDMTLIPPPLMRPGRLGDEIYIIDDMVVNDDVRKRIISGFETKVGFEIPEEHREQFFDAYKQTSLSEAFLIEVLKRAKVEGSHRIAEMLKDFIDDTEEEEYDEYESYEGEDDY